MKEKPRWEVFQFRKGMKKNRNVRLGCTVPSCYQSDQTQCEQDPADLWGGVDEGKEAALQYNWLLFPCYEHNLETLIICDSEGS
jgi:hypothetical protein